MHVRHANPHTTTVGHDGHEFHALRDGIFDVPDEVGHALLAHPLWERYYGEAPYEVSSAAPAVTPAEAPATGPKTDAPVDWFARGEEAARAGTPRTPLPDELKDRPRHGDSRKYLAGHDSVTGADPGA